MAPLPIAPCHGFCYHQGNETPTAMEGTMTYAEATADPSTALYRLMRDGELARAEMTYVVNALVAEGYDRADAWRAVLQRVVPVTRAD